MPRPASDASREWPKVGITMSTGEVQSARGLAVKNFSVQRAATALIDLVKPVDATQTRKNAPPQGSRREGRDAAE